MSTTNSRPASSADADVAISIDGSVLAREIAGLGITHVITVPDTIQKTLIAALEKQGSPKMLYVSTEDEAVGINAGLYIAGRNPMLLIQNKGLYACVNALRGIALEASVPTLMLVGQHTRDVTKPVEQNASRSVRLLEPMLAALGIPFFRMESPQELGALRNAWQRAQEDRGPAAAIVGAPTS
jgi:sulfopyruvate decarboxylase TPP-binding subunit